MTDQTYNPIKSVGGVQIPCPAVYEWSLNDISASDAGRTEDTVMWKKRVGQCAKVHLEWHYVDDAAAQTILSAFNGEYISIQYVDAMRGTRTSVFYVGDRSSVMYNHKLGLWENISFDIIERSGK